MVQNFISHVQNSTNFVQFCTIEIIYLIYLLKKIDLNISSNLKYIYNLLIFFNDEILVNILVEKFNVPIF